MVALIIQTILLMAIAFILGAAIGCLLRSLFGSATQSAPRVSAATGVEAGAGVATGAAVGATSLRKPKAPITPAPPMPKVPQRPIEKARVETPPPAPVNLVTPVAKKSAPKKTSAVRPKSTKKPAHRSTAPVGKADNLKLIRGIGPQNEGRLNSLGVNQFAQIAGWNKKDQEHYGDALAFPGRVEREDWVGQAKVLAKGGATDFAKRVKEGTVTTSVGNANAGEMGTKPNKLLKSARSGKPDNLTLIDGVGNAIEKKMFKLGIFHFDQVAEMSANELIWLGISVGFPGRPERENWAGESRILAKGGTTAHAQKVKRGQIKTSRKSTDSGK